MEKLTYGDLTYQNVNPLAAFAPFLSYPELQDQS